MASRCRHRRYTLEHARVGGNIGLTFDMWTRRCAVCGYGGPLLPFGPANDTPEVLVELRAAELAADYLDRRDFWLTVSADEHDGWSMHYGMRGDFDAPGKWSGWLAREIATHGEEQG